MANIKVPPRFRVVEVQKGIFVRNEMETPEKILPDPVYRCVDCGEEGVTPVLGYDGFMVADESHFCRK